MYDDAMTDRIYTTSAAAAAIGRSARTVRRACQRLDLQRVGRVYLIRESDLPALREATHESAGNPQFGTAALSARGVAARRKRRKSAAK